ncbi:MAG: M20/M25/M40 family metallo-hydrolase [Pyrinomonadaceae bacterium]
MKKQIFSLLLVLFLLTGVSSAQKRSKEEKRLQTHVVYLASDKLEGRRTGETGATYAAGYVANMFAEYKLKTATGGDAKSYLHKFPFVTGVELGQSNLLTINNQQLSLKTDWMPVGFSNSGDPPSAPVVFAGFGIASGELKYDSYENIDIRNKIALVFADTPESGDPHSQFVRFADARVKAKIAGDKGAKALIIISAEKNLSEDKLAGLGYDQTLGETSIPTAVISRAVAGRLLGAKNEAELDEVEKWIAMRKDAPENIRISLANRPMSAALKVDLPKTTAEAYNVIGILEGRDPVLKNEAIVIGAHYDHLGHGGQGSLAVNSKDIHHGADDNASGVAAVIELARYFSKEKENKRTLIFMAFGGEEEGLLGSKAYVNDPVFPLDKTVAMINMDMVGRLHENKLTIGGMGTASEWSNLIEENNWTKGGKVLLASLNSADAQKNSSTPLKKFELSLSQDGFGPSDHSSFYGKQIPVLFFFTGTHTDYHKPSDTSDKINYDGLEKITDFVAGIVRSIDQNPNRPTYTQAQSSGTTGGRRGFNVSLGTVPSYADNANDGLALDGVRDNSPAAKAGLKAGDKIIKLAGRDINNISDYVFVLGEMKADEEYEVVVMRGTEKLTLKITPEGRK